MFSPEYKDLLYTYILQHTATYCNALQDVSKHTWCCRARISWTTSTDLFVGV